jgi:hypothetical protein
MAVVFGFNLLSEFQRAIDPALKSYKQPNNSPHCISRFLPAAPSWVAGHHLVLHSIRRRTDGVSKTDTLHMSKNWGGYSQRKPLFTNLLPWPPPAYLERTTNAPAYWLGSSRRERLNFVDRGRPSICSGVKRFLAVTSV